MDDDIVPDLLRAIRADMAGLRADIPDIRERAGNLESAGSTRWRRTERT